MKIVSDLAGDYKDGYNTALRMDELSEDDGASVLFFGIQCAVDKMLLRAHANYKRKVILDLWSPCAFFVEPNHFSMLEGFDEVYSICPYTAEWTNRKLGRPLMKYGFYPVNPRYVEMASRTRLKPGLGGRLLELLSGRSWAPTTGEDGKDFDVCYVGGLYSDEHTLMIDIISRFNYVFVTQSDAKKATHRYLSNAGKLNLIRRSKIGICFNKLYLTPAHLASVYNYEDWQSNQAFSNVSDAIPVAPQIKTRLHELALCKSLILCHRDHWNLVEDYYEPGKEFIYFDKIEDLRILIPQILANWDSYQPIIENAYAKAHTFSTANLVKMIREGREFERKQ